jgi:hypothetical protein
MFRSLVWKEWHEQRWRLWFGVFLLGVFTLIGLRTRIMPDEQIVVFTIIVGGMLLPLMASMGLVAPERAEGTIVRLLALPVPTWKVVAAKGVVGALVCATPILVSAIIGLLMAGSREMPWDELIGLYGIGLGVALSMLSWLTAIGIRQPSEARAGLVGIGAVVGWSLLVAIGGALESEFGMEMVVWVAALSPMGFVALRGAPISPAVVIAAQLVSVAALWGWSAKRIAKPGKVVA